jgi:hypothetical protein
MKLLKPIALLALLMIFAPVITPQTPTSLQRTIAAFNSGSGISCTTGGDWYRRIVPIE